MTFRVDVGDCVELMAAMGEASVDAVVCDPPYGLEFMGKEWDRLWRRAENEADVGRDSPHGRTSRTSPEYAAGIAAQRWHELWATEALRVLKPGGHLLAFGGTRTYHRLACAVEDAGFEIRDTICWLYGSGFPKSLDVSKAIDKAARGVPQGAADPTSPNHGRYRTQATEGQRGDGDHGQGYGAGPGAFMAEPGESNDRELVPEAEEWDGWGTALKPAHEPIVVARKPLAGTVAANVLEHGTGALNVDGCRVGTEPEDDARRARRSTTALGLMNDDGWEPTATATGGHEAGRWPANVVLDEEAAATLDEQSGERPTGAVRPYTEQHEHATSYRLARDKTYTKDSDSGGASRFFYCAKASRAERNAGLDGFEERTADPYGEHRGRRMEDKSRIDGKPAKIAQNHHPTVKPISLMRWLTRLVTPPDGLVLDPFTGSGTTGIAASLEGFRFVGLERDAEYAAIAEARIRWWAEHGEQALEIVARAERAEQERAAAADAGQLDIFSEDAA